MARLDLSTGMDLIEPSSVMVLPSPHIQEPQCVTATDLKVKCLWHTSLYESQKNVL